MSINFPYSSWIHSTKPTQQIFHNFNAPKIQHHILPILPKFMTHQHCSSYTMPKKYNKKKCPKAKITTWLTLQCLKFQQEHTTTQWQCLNIKFSIPSFKLSIPKFKFSILSFKFQIPNFKFQIPNSKFQVSSLKISSGKFSNFKFKFKISSFQFQSSSFENQIFFKELQKSIKVFLIKM